MRCAHALKYNLFKVISVLSKLSHNPNATYESQAEKAIFDALPLVEQNALLIAELEKEWSILGPLRLLTFTVRFSLEREAQALAQAAKDNGFDVKIADWGSEESLPYVLIATRQIAPSAQEITLWEKWFKDQVAKVPELNNEAYHSNGVDFLGWSYPRKLRPSYSLGGDAKRSRIRHPHESEARTRILFGETLCDFEASNGWADKTGAFKSGPFQIAPTKFIDNAREHRPQRPEPTASGFSQWLYSLYSTAHGKEEDMKRGKSAEQDIQAMRRKAFVSTNAETMRRSFPGWRLKHNGMSDQEKGKRRYFEVNGLVVSGQALRVLPDLVYENTLTGALIIVEVKHSYMTIPINLWPNIWGQLWCYSQMPDAIASPSVTVVGEVWGDKYYRHNDFPYVYLRASVRRDPRAPAFDRFFRCLFDIYRGV